MSGMTVFRRYKAVCLGVVLYASGVASGARAQYLSSLVVTAGTHNTSNGSFTGSMGSVGVTGTATSGTTGSFTYNATTAGTSGLSAWELSNTAGNSPQFNYATSFASPVANASTIGYTFWGLSTNTATVNLTFSRPVTNLVFQFANLDNSIWDFAASGGVTSLNLLKGNNGADGDGIGIGVSGKTVIDRLNGDTGQAPSATPFTNGTTNRSAYGSVQVVGTYSSLTINLTATHSNGGDGGNFTMALIPEPGSLLFFIAGLAGAGGVLFRRCRPSV